MALSPIEELAASRDEDNALNSENAVSRMRGRLPGIGQPGSTLATDLTNSDVAAAMDQADLTNRSAFAPPVQSSDQSVAPGVVAPGVAAAPGYDIREVRKRRAHIDQALQDNRDPDAYAILPSPKRRAALNLERKQLFDVEHQHAMLETKQAGEELTKQRDLEVTTQAKNALDGLAQIPMDGSPKSAAKMLKLKKDYILAWLHSPGVRDEFKTHAQTHDAVAAELTPPAGMEVASVTRDSTGKEHAIFKPIVSPADQETPAGMEVATVSRDSSGKEHKTFKLIDSGKSEDAIKQLQQLHKITPNELLNPVSVKRGKIEGDKFTNSYAGADKGEAIQIDTGSRVVTMSNSEYDRFKSVLQPKAVAVTIPPAPTDATARQPNTTYQTPKGPMKWTGTGWVPAQ